MMLDKNPNKRPSIRKILSHRIIEPFVFRIVTYSDEIKR